MPISDPAAVEFFQQNLSGVFVLPDRHANGFVIKDGMLRVDYHPSIGLMKLSGGASMSSREIAELVNSNHADVRRSIGRIVERGVISLPPLAEVPNPGPGPKTIKVYRFTCNAGKALNRLSSGG